ncbi:MAG: hypothetical protein AB7K64_11410 [Variibacter sp.]
MPNAPHNPDNPAAPPSAAPPSEEREEIVQDNAFQADPQLHLSSGRATKTQITITTIAALVILFVVFYGLNNHQPETAQSPAATTSETASGGTATPQPAAGGQANAQAPAANNQENTGASQNNGQAKK